MTSPAAPPPEPAANNDRSRAVLALRDLMLAGESFRVAVAQYYGVGVRETEAVSYLRVHGAMIPSRLAHALSVSTGTVSNLIDRLERAGLAQRLPDPADRRRTLVQLTEIAQQRADEALRWLDDCFHDVPDLDGATDTLRVLTSRLRARSARLTSDEPVRRQRRERTDV